MIREVIIWPDPILGKTCSPVSTVDNNVRELLCDMEETLLACKGVGLAAPQIGFRLRLITVLVRVREPAGYEVLKLVDPRIIERDDTPQLLREGCLSLPGYYAVVSRCSKVTVAALDETGRRVEVQATGLLAQVLQHEIDHLDGIVFSDHLSALKRHVAFAKFTRLKKEGLRWHAERPEPKDFTDLSAKARPPIAAELLEELTRLVPVK